MPSICAVYGCSSSSTNKNTILQGVKFYSFSGAPWVADRMTKWIYFCNRTNPDGTEWKPTKTSKICSLHFVGGSKSEHPLHPAYNPTIHPKPPRKNSQLITAENTFQRAQDRMGKRLSNFKTNERVESKNREETDVTSTADTLQNLHNSQPCCLCFEHCPGIPCDESMQAGRFKDTLSNLIQVMEISINPSDELFTAPETWNMSFCQKCDTLIQHGLYLKKQLLVIQSDILGQSLGWDPHFDEGSKSKDSADLPERFRCELRNRVVACEAKLSEETTNLKNTERDANGNESNSEEPMEQADSSSLLPASPEEEESLLEHGNVSQTPKECTIPTTTVPYLPDSELQLPPEIQSRTETIESAVVPLATILPARRSAALVSAVKMGTSARNLDNRFACDSCRTMCSSEDILTLHRVEEHESSEDAKFVYNCDVCHGELNAFMFINHDALPNKRYSTSINGKMRYFAQFFRLCEAHYTKCAKEQLHNTSTAHSVETGDAPFVKCKQIDIVGRSEPVVPCLLCHSTFSVETSSIIKHYTYFHGLNLYFEDRFSCTGCFTPYESSQPGVGIGKIAPDDLEHFKEFCKQHLLCNETKHPAKSYLCKLCPNFQVFRTPAGIFAHDIKSHTHDEKYRCSVCSNRFVDYEDFRAHATKDHRASIRWYCAICSESFHLRRDYLEHVTTVHRKKSSMCVCFVCGCEQKSTLTLRRHMDKNHGQNKRRSYGCKTYSPRQLGYQAIKKERQSKNVDHIKHTRYFNCFLCDHSLQTAQLLDLHLREIHDPVPGNLNFKCVCGEAFKQTEFLIKENVKHPEYKYPARINLSGKEIAVRTFSEHCNNHVLLCLTWLETKDQLEASSMFKCSKCKKTTNSAVDYITHLRSHYADLLKTCYFCEFSINDPKKMDSHIFRIHHLKKLCYQQYYCRYCRECYAPKRADLETGRFVMEELDNFKKFGLLHAVCAKIRPEPKTSFKCKFCDKILTVPFDLFKHEIQEHTKNFVAFCDQCGAGYANQSALNNHLKLHGEKSFKCEQCPATFLKQSRLIHHYRVHTGERPFVCEKCGKGFHANDHLKVHMQRHRETADIPCTICGHMFRSMPGLRCHLYSIHNVRKKKKLAGS